MSKEAMKLALEALELSAVTVDSFGVQQKTHEAITALREALAEQPAPVQQEPVAKPYAYEYGRDNGDGTYSVVIEKGDLVQTAPAVYNYVRPRNAHKDWTIKELFDRPPAQRTWVGLTSEELDEMFSKTLKGKKLVNWVAKAIEAKLREKNNG
jgi:hypothetical protein